jgi:hypothetical protein
MPLGFTERVNKGIAYFSGLERARELGYDAATAHIIGLKQATTIATPIEFTQAEWFAWRRMYGSQFGYSRAQQSPIFAGPGMQWFTPFYSFPFKSLQFTANLLKSAYGIEKIVGRGQTLETAKMMGESLAKMGGYKESGDIDINTNASMLRFLALTGFMVSAPIIASQTLGIDVTSLWGIKGLFPMQILPAWLNGINDLYVASGGLGMMEIPPTYTEREKALRNFGKLSFLLGVPQGRFILKAKDSYERLDKGYYTMGADKLPSYETNLGMEIANLFGWPPYKKDIQQEVYDALRVNRDFYAMKHDMIMSSVEAMNEGNYDSAAGYLRKFYDKYGVTIKDYEIRDFKRNQERDNIFERTLRVMAKEFKPQYKLRLSEAERKAMPKDSRKPQRSMWLGKKEMEEED